MFAIRSARVAVTALMLVLGTVLGSTGAVHAAGQSVVFPIVSPNSRVCLSPVPANQYVEIDAFASNHPNNNPQATYTLNRSVDGGINFNQVYTVTTTSVHAIFSTSLRNFAGPGLYKLCARNSTGAGETISLTINTY